MSIHRALAASVAALALLLASSAPAAEAQTTPFTAYGLGLEPGQVVTAFIGGVACAAVEADADGNWLMQIPATAPCAPSEGDTIKFTLDGQPTTAKATWTPGGAPDDIAEGIVLAVPDDVTPPVVNPPVDIVVYVTEGATGAPASHDKIAAFLDGAIAKDAVDGQVPVTHDAPDVFPVGETVVTFTAVDDAGNEATAIGRVTVVAGGAGSAPGKFDPAPAPKGISLAVWGGGDVSQALAAAGDGTTSLWAFIDGKPVGYTAGAPDFVNAVFLEVFAQGFIPAGQAVLVVKLGG